MQRDEMMPGGQFPDVELPDHVGNLRKLSDLAGGDPPSVAAAFRGGLGARWTFLSDDDRVRLNRLELREVTDPGNSPYLPTVLTLLPDLTIHTMYNGYWFWGRPSNEELRLDFRRITQRIRGDWEPPVDREDT